MTIFSIDKWAGLHYGLQTMTQEYLDRLRELYSKSIADRDNAFADIQNAAIYYGNASQVTAQRRIDVERAQAEFNAETAGVTELLNAIDRLSSAIRALSLADAAQRSHLSCKDNLPVKEWAEVNDATVHAEKAAKKARNVQ